MTPDPLETALKRLTPTGGPTPESVAFTAGRLVGEADVRRRYGPVLVVLSVAAAIGWGLVLLPPPPTPTPVPPPVPPALRTPPPTFDWPGSDAYLAHLDLMNRLATEGLVALGPIPPPGVELPRSQFPENWP